MLLTFLKFFTGVIHEMGDPTTRLVIKVIPTLSNEWYMGEENAKTIRIHSGTWYFERRYISVIADEHGFPGYGLYLLMIKGWWLTTSGMIAYSAIGRFKRVGRSIM